MFNDEQHYLLKLYRDRVARRSGLMLLLLLALALAAPIYTPQNPYDLAQLNLLDAKLPPLHHSPDGAIYWLGTDDQGRDMLSALCYGLRTSLGVGLITTLLSLSLGLLAGLVAAYSGNYIDSMLMRLVDLQLAFPAILIALILLALVGQGIDKVIIALVIVQWAYYARTVRSAALTEMRKDYITAAICAGYSPMRIVLIHILPNIIPTLLVVASAQIAQAIALEATLSFLGLGLPITAPSLGLLIVNGYTYMLSGTYWISLFPGVVLLITIFIINITGDRISALLNPRLQ